MRLLLVLSALVRVATCPGFRGTVPIFSAHMTRPGKTLGGTPNVPLFCSSISAEVRRTKIERSDPLCAIVWRSAECNISP